MDLKPVTGSEPSSFISQNAEPTEDQNEPIEEVAVVDVDDSEVKVKTKGSKSEEHQLLNQ